METKALIKLLKLSKPEARSGGVTRYTRKLGYLASVDALKAQGFTEANLIANHGAEELEHTFVKDGLEVVVGADGLDRYVRIRTIPALVKG